MSQTPLREIALLFTRLGFTAFGGPAAHIAMMREEVVVRRGWMTDADYLDMIGATNLIPGPNSTEMAIHIGYDRGGWKGLIIAGLCFILPAVCITGFLAWMYQQYGQLPALQPYIYGVKPAIIAIVLMAILPLARRSIRDIWAAQLAIVALLLALGGVSEIYLLFGAGAIALGLYAIRSRYYGSGSQGLFPWFLIEISGHTTIRISDMRVFFIFLKIGAILYGSGYVLFAFMDAELVSTGLLSRRVLTDAIAVGQFTPGPVFSAVTFVGYQMNGLSGAIAATVGVFLPSFVFVAMLKPLMKVFRSSVLFSVFLDAVNVASIALIVSICLVMSCDIVTDWRTIAIGVSCLAIGLIWPKLNSVWFILGGSISGYLLSLI